MKKKIEVEKIFFGLQWVKTEKKENEENKFYKLIWFRGEENYFLRFYNL